MTKRKAKTAAPERAIDAGLGGILKGLGNLVEKLGELAETLAVSYEVKLTGLVSMRESVRQQAIAKGLDALETLPAPTPKASTDAPQDLAKYLRATVRSGTVIETPGHLVIIGDVNAGAELRAGGDIIVFGTLRGVAHAGYGGELASSIFAINLRPTQLRIGSLIARSPDGGQPPLSKFPERAVVEDGEIHIHPV
jgi:septum site-determining protein MinC